MRYDRARTSLDRHATDTSLPGLPSHRGARPGRNRHTAQPSPDVVAGSDREPPFGVAVACRNDRYAAAQNQAICADGRRACLLVELRLMVGGKVLTLP
jgi:hypothetical protein